MSKEKTFWGISIGNMRVTAFNAEKKIIFLCPTILTPHKKFTEKELAQFKKVAPCFQIGGFLDPVSLDFKYTEYLDLD